MSLSRCFIIYTFFQGVVGTYMFVDYFLQQDEAEYVCEQYNMVLPKISTMNDNSDFLNHVIKAADRNDFSVWLGLRHDRSLSLDPSKFKWLDGTTPVFMNLDSGVVADMLYTQYCFRLDLATGLWHSTPCIQTYRFVCLEKKDLLPDPASAPTLTPATIPSRYLWGVNEDKDTTGDKSSYYRLLTSVPSGEIIVSSFVSGASYMSDCLSICLKNNECTFVIILDTTSQCMTHKNK